MTPKEFCNKYNACKGGTEFAIKYGTMAEVWENCQRIDWLCWILVKMEIVPNESEVRKFMCWVATETPLADGRKTLDLLTDERSRNAVKVALRFAYNEANSEELSAARSAAWSAAESAAETAAWSAAESAAESAEWSAAESAAISAARSAAWSAAESAQSIEFKKRFQNPFTK